MGSWLHELVLEAAAVGGAKHCARMRCPSPTAAAKVLAQVLRRSWAMAAFRCNARLMIRRLCLVGLSAGRADGCGLYVRRRMDARRDYACERYGMGGGMVVGAH